jgi:hypothetical protein
VKHVVKCNLEGKELRAIVCTHFLVIKFITSQAWQSNHHMLFVNTGYDGVFAFAGRK